METTFANQNQEFSSAIEDFFDRTSCHWKLCTTTEHTNRFLFFTFSHSASCWYSDHLLIFSLLLLVLPSSIAASWRLQTKNLRIVTLKSNCQLRVMLNKFDNMIKWTRIFHRAWPLDSDYFQGFRRIKYFELRLM